MDAFRRAHDSFCRSPHCATSPTLSALPVSQPPCNVLEYRSFDFWIGDWDVYEVAELSTRVAHTGVDSILGGCVLHEDYQQDDGMHGESFSIYDTTRKVWHQSWVTNRGRLLWIEGPAKSGEIVLTGADLTPDGKVEQVRGTWKAVEGGVRETAFTFLDGGKNWTPRFDLFFRAASSSVTKQALLTGSENRRRTRRAVPSSCKDK